MRSLHIPGPYNMCAKLMSSGRWVGVLPWGGAVHLEPVEDSESGPVLQSKQCPLLALVLPDLCPRVLLYLLPLHLIPPLLVTVKSTGPPFGTMVCRDNPDVGGLTLVLCHHLELSLVLNTSEIFSWASGALLFFSVTSNITSHLSGSRALKRWFCQKEVVTLMIKKKYTGHLICKCYSPKDWTMRFHGSVGIK